MTAHQTDGRQDGPGRKPYESPRLEVYGDIRDVTNSYRKKGEERRRQAAQVQDTIAPSHRPPCARGPMPSFYSAFGLSLCANRPVSGLLPRSDAAGVDTRISLDPAAWPPAVDDSPEILLSSRKESDVDAPALRVWRLAGDAGFRLLYNDGHEFVVDRRGTEVWARWPGSSTIEDAATYLLGPILGFVLRLRGVTSLHASAVTIGGSAIALLGPPDAGKSTTAACFARMGYPVLADDIVALVERDGGLCVQPAYPQLRLWPESVALLYGTADALPRLTPTWDKRALDLAGAGCRFEEQPRSLSAIYVLAGRDAEADARRGIEALPSRQRLLTLLANTYAGYLLDGEMRAQDFETLGRVVSSVAVRRIVSPADVRDPPAVLCDRILEDYASLGRPAARDGAR